MLTGYDFLKYALTVVSCPLCSWCCVGFRKDLSWARCCTFCTQLSWPWSLTVMASACTIMPKTVLFGHWECCALWLTVKLCHLNHLTYLLCQAVSWFSVSCVCHWRRYLILKDSFVAYLRPKDGTVSDVLLMDRDFCVQTGLKATGFRNGLLISNLSRFCCVVRFIPYFAVCHHFCDSIVYWSTHRV